MYTDSSAFIVAAFFIARLLPNIIKDGTSMTEQRTCKFICTRPQLATILMEHGHELTITRNPWKPTLAAWLCDLNADTAAIISEFYNSIGREAPANVKRVLDGGTEA